MSYQAFYRVRFNEDFSDLCHYGVRGQKKGHRRFQNEDGSLTTLGRQHYGIGEQIRGAYLKATKKERAAARKEKSDIDQAMYEHGRNVGNTYFFRKARAKYAERNAPEEKKSGVIGNAVKKVASNFGLDDYADMATKYVKDATAKTLINQAKHPGKLIKAANTMRKPLNVAGKGVIGVGHVAERVAKKTPKAAIKTVGFIGKTVGKVGKRSIGWLHKGGNKKLVSGKKKLMNMMVHLGKKSARMIMSGGRTAVQKAQRNTPAIGRMVSQGARAIVRRIPNIRHS